MQPGRGSSIPAPHDSHTPPPQGSYRRTARGLLMQPPPWIRPLTPRGPQWHQALGRPSGPLKRTLAGEERGGRGGGLFSVLEFLHS